jgi:hypothetical protein
MKGDGMKAIISSAKDPINMYTGSGIVFEMLSKKFSVASIIHTIIAYALWCFKVLCMAGLSVSG